MTADQNHETPSTQPSPSTLHKVLKPVILLAVVGAVVYGYLQLGDNKAILASLAKRETQLREYQLTQPVLVYAVAFAVYVTVTGLSLPGAAAMSLVFGWFFGFWRGLILVSFASTMGATVAFLLSRYLFRNAVQKRFGDHLKKFNAALEKEGAFYLFTLRLIVAVPFFVINIVMGLTPIKAWTYWWVSQLGMLPGTAVYIYAGAAVPSLNVLAERGVKGVLNWQIALAFALLGLFPILVKKLITKPALTE